MGYSWAHVYVGGVNVAGLWRCVLVMLDRCGQFHEVLKLPVGKRRRQLVQQKVGVDLAIASHVQSGERIHYIACRPIGTRFNGKSFEGCVAEHDPILRQRNALDIAEYPEGLNVTRLHLSAFTCQELVAFGPSRAYQCRVFCCENEFFHVPWIGVSNLSQDGLHDNPSGVRPHFLQALSPVKQRHVRILSPTGVKRRSLCCGRESPRADHLWF
mmetsp:Transcript_20075/g.35680  ORF Transcript_20075/g.35680 Transcript_20075/m.35680 type:complete len:213 (-) Transcript_20075:1211-1849(-)